MEIHYSAAKALVDAENRPNKAIWIHIPNGIYAVGDSEDLPHRSDEGSWHELSLKGLQLQAEWETRA